MSEIADEPFGPELVEVEDEGGYQDPDLETTADEIQQQVFDDLAGRAPGWEAADGNLDTWLIEAFSAEAANLRELVVDVPSAIFRTFGEQIMGVTSRVASPALASATFTAIDDQGYVIEAGFQLAIPRSGNESIAFEVVSEVEILAGQTETAPGVVSLAAVTPGEGSNGLLGPVEVIEPVDWVQSVVLTAPTAGGDDGQTDEQYLDELSQLMRLVALRPVLPGDFATLALTIPGVGRAVAMDGYDPDTDTWNHDRTVTVVVTDEQGEPLPESIKQQVDDYLQSKREVNFVINVIDAQYEDVDVSSELVTFTGYDPAVVRETVINALTAYLSPANWRLGLSSPSMYGGEVISGPPPEGGHSVVRQYELAVVLNSGLGVDYVETILIDGVDDDFALSGLTTLPRPGAIDAAVTTPEGVTSP